jgi:hypothetical protein
VYKFSGNDFAIIWFKTLDEKSPVIFCPVDIQYGDNAESKMMGQSLDALESSSKCVIAR